MQKLAGITPILARTVMVVAALTTVLSIVTVVAVGEPSILPFAAFSTVSGLYAWKVLRVESAAPPVETLERSATRLAA